MFFLGKYVLTEDEKVLFNNPLGIENDDRVIEILEKYIHHLITPKGEEIDCRLLVLKGNLLLEYSIECFADSLFQDEDFEKSLHKKIKIIKSLKMIPDWIWDISLLLNEIRNKFSHDLEVSSFDEISDKMGRLRSYFDYLYPEKEDNFDDYNFYRGILYDVCKIILSFKKNVTIFRQFTRSDRFEEDFKEYCENYINAH